MTKNILKMMLIGSLCMGLSGCAAVVVGTAATGLLVAQDRRSAGTMVDDKGVEFKATQAIEDTLGDEADRAHVSVTSYNHQILVLGQVPTPEMRTKVEQAVRSVSGAETLHNELQISAPTSMLTRSSDSWITTKIKSEMLVNKKINPTKVKVITEDGVVYLVGIVKPQEETIAVDIARHTKGVKKVVKMFEHLQG